MQVGDSASFAALLTKHFPPPQGSTSGWFIKTSRSLRKKRTALMPSWKLLSGERSPKVQDPNLREQKHAWFNAWYQWRCDSSFPLLYSPSNSAPISMLSTMQCERWCPNKCWRSVCQCKCTPSPPPHGQAAGSPSETILSWWCMCPQGSVSEGYLNL